MGERGSVRVFPFAPRSNSRVERGDFWAIRTRRGGWYACGVVLWDGRGSGSRTKIAVGLLDWCGPQLPTCADVGRAKVIDYGVAHIRTIETTGAHVIGNCTLATAPTAQEVAIAASRFEIPAWGLDTIEFAVHAHIGRHFPEHPAVATERPAALE